MLHNRSQAGAAISYHDVKAHGMQSVGFIFPYYMDGLQAGSILVL